MHRKPIKRRVVEEVESYSAREKRKPEASRLQDQRFIVQTLDRKLETKKGQAVALDKPASEPDSKKEQTVEAPVVIPNRPQGKREATVPKSIVLQQARFGWEMRSLDGSGNNLKHPQWGRSDTPMRRLGKSCSYSMDQARQLSNQICASDRILKGGNLSLLWVGWSMLIDHDLSLVMQTDCPAHIDCKDDPRESYPGRRIEFYCSEQQDGSPVNSVSSYLDCSVIYGSTTERAAALRSWTQGKLLTEHNLLPKNGKNMPNFVPAANKDFYLAGDPRVNENAILMALQTILVREHNFWCQKLSDSNPNLRDYDELLYQQARAITIGIVQSITYNEWLPLMGVQLPAHTYNQDCNPTVSVEFACCKWWLSMWPAHLSVGRDRLPLSQTAFKPELAKNLDVLLQSAANQPALPIQEQIVDQLRNTSDGDRVGDQAAELIQRARDHNASDYYSLCKALGIQSKSIEQLGDAPIQTCFRSMGNIDAWLGASCEHDRQLFKALIYNQLLAVRDGDRFWYQINPGLSQELKTLIDQTRLCDVLKRHCKGNFPAEVFKR